MGISAKGLRTYVSSLVGPPVAYTTYTFAHGLGDVPRNFALYWRCVTADLGWSAGDEVLHPWIEGIGDYAGGLWADATNVYFVVGPQNVSLPIKTTGGASPITPASWRMFVKAEL
jgi:hypothetical protein